MGSISILAAALVIVAKRIPFIGQSLFLGFKFWTAWLPAVATLFFAVVVLGNVTANSFILELLPLPTGFSKPELLLLCILTASFLTKIGSLSALLALLYLTGKSVGMTAQSSQELQTVAALFFASASVVALNDFSPWKKRASRAAGISSQLGRILELVVCLLAVGAITVTMFRLPAFGRWLEGNFDFALSTKGAFTILSLTLFVWLGVSIKIINNNLGIALILPTIVVLTFLCHTSFSLGLAFIGMASAISLLANDRTSAQPSNLTSKFY